MQLPLQWVWPSLLAVKPCAYSHFAFKIKPCSWLEGLAYWHLTENCKLFSPWVEFTWKHFKNVILLKFSVWTTGSRYLQEMSYPTSFAFYKALEICLSLPVFVLFTALIKRHKPVATLVATSCCHSEARVETYDLSVQVRVQLDPQRMNGCVLVLWFYGSILWGMHLHNTGNHSQPLLR